MEAAVAVGCWPRLWRKLEASSEGRPGSGQRWRRAARSGRSGRAAAPPCRGGPRRHHRRRPEAARWVVRPADWDPRV